MKTVAKRKLASLVYMEGKIFLYTPNFRIFVFLVKWKKFFCKNLVKYPNKSIVTFQYKWEGCKFYDGKNLCKPLSFVPQVFNYSGITIFYEKNFV